MRSSKRWFSGIFFQLFLGLWSVFLVIGLALGLLSASYQQTIRSQNFVDSGQIGVRAVKTAVCIYELGAEKGLLEWLGNKSLNSRPEVMAINDDGKDVLGRRVPESLKRAVQQHSEKVTTIHTTYGTLKLIAVRTNTSSRPFVFAFWHTPTWALLLLAFLATMLVAMLLAWYFASPIRKLEAAMRRATEGNLTEKIAPTVGHRLDEIGDLALRYDAMTEKINGLLERQKTLFHDVSHELRSPLARIEVAIALIDKNPANSKEIIKRIENEVDILDALVEELLTYARLDKNAPIVFEPANIVPILEAVAENANFEGGKNHVTVELASPKELLVNSHVESLASAFENLTRNALRFSPQGGFVHINARQEGATIYVDIVDQGPGMNEDDLSRLFLPFVRGKNQATGSGFGLGLAIAKRAIERHGGKIYARNTTPHGLAMCVELKAIDVNEAT